ncbi:glutathione peroxidase [Flavisolibacter nicotianae]|uniref:glutathione peroxidase n=1 Tax=Flavisolibacter nicotianae TaxID=2364882 RepID=UPI000EB315DB|nr:glutathione peroxidase [Flavisolibacter nicotianae]
MTIRQTILKWLYPLLMWGRKKSTGDKLLHNENKTAAPVSFYSLSAVLNNGRPLSFESLKGKKVLLVNTASDCGYTAQYADLQQLYALAKNNLAIIAFPANDFKAQETGSDAEIARFCSVNYGVEFPLAQKAVVVKNNAQHPVYRWLTTPSLNGWNSQAPTWNFSKYLINEEGLLTHFFDPAVSPLDPVVRNAIRG